MIGNFEKKKNIGKIGALVVVGLFVAIALAMPAVGDTTDLWNRDAGGFLYPEVSINDGIAIGTTSPSAKVHIIQTASADAFRVDDQASDTTPFIIDQDGRVGIGDTSPDFKLEVTGSSGSGYFGVTSASYLNFLLSGILASFF